MGAQCEGRSSGGSVCESDTGSVVRSLRLILYGSAEEVLTAVPLVLLSCVGGSSEEDDEREEETDSAPFTLSWP